jgi:hypothetical protein
MSERSSNVGHGKTVCSCGAVISQCRCVDHGGLRTVVQNGCGRCGPNVTVTPAPPFLAEIDRTLEALHEQLGRTRRAAQAAEQHMAMLREEKTQGIDLLRRAAKVIRDLQQGEPDVDEKSHAETLADMRAYLARVALESGT